MTSQKLEDLRPGDEPQRDYAVKWTTDYTRVHCADRRALVAPIMAALVMTARAAGLDGHDEILAREAWSLVDALLATEHEETIVQHHKRTTGGQVGQ